jgi:uncharacterized membrane protein (DUF2068 family)
MSNKRSRWINVLVGFQFCYVLVLLALPVYLLALALKSGVQNGFHPTETTKGLSLAAAIVGIPGVFALVAWIGLWKQKLWGWWLSIVIDLALVAIFAYSVIDDGWKDIDWEVVGLTAIAILPVIGLLLPKVRRFYWSGAGSSPLPEIAAAPQ